MKQLLYALMAFCAFGLLSCRKSGDDITITQFDANQIQTYMQQNGLTNMKRDTVGGDTSGIYYQIITPGTGATVTYSDKVHYTYTVRSFDGKYILGDSILNHTSAYLGYINPLGLQYAIKNILKRKGGKMRVLIPSRQAYGVNGATVSYYTAAGVISTYTIQGNQCLDFTVTLVDNDVVTTGGQTVDRQAQYDDVSIKSYMSANGLSGYTKTVSGIYYKIIKAGTGTDPIVLNNSLVDMTYNSAMLDGVIFDPPTGTVPDVQTVTSEALLDLPIAAWKEILPKVTSGASVSFITPSSQAYGPEAAVPAVDPTTGASGFSIPAYTCIRIEFTITGVTN